MQITKIVQQQKQRDRYSIFVDDKYSFSLSKTALLDSKLTSGQELTRQQVAEYKQKSADDKLYTRTLRWVALRPRSVWEAQDYLRRHDCPAPLTEQITNKLVDIGLLDDQKFAEVFVRDRRLLRSASVRKITLELRKKHVPDAAIEQAIAGDETDELVLLRQLVAKKRQQTKYRDDNLKLMQYLARQGFNYSDIKAVLESVDE